MENRMALDLFIGICGALCLIVGASILLGKLVMWIQEKLRLRREEKELGKIVQQQKRWENLEKELAKLDNSSAIDMASDPKPWQMQNSDPLHNPENIRRYMPLQEPEIQEAPHTLWCPRCNSGKRHLAHAVGGVPHFKCEDCGQRYKQSPTQNQIVNRYDRNAVPTDTPSASSIELHEVLDSGDHWPGVVMQDDEPRKGGCNETADEPVTFGGGDFGGSGAGDSYDSSTDSSSSSTDSSSSSDYSSSNDD
ncbi:MAG TPA: hypothetical protein VN038_01370 [Dyadobacter sp.]|nr:hypothetical protein [Dyadobacter sp.]